MVALPALGAFFVAHLAHQDWHRMEQELENRNVWAARSFMVAFVGDAMDVAFHVVVVLGLLYTHFQVGVYDGSQGILCLPEASTASKMELR
jgi:hypothetical protein